MTGQKKIAVINLRFCRRLKVLYKAACAKLEVSMTEDIEKHMREVVQKAHGTDIRHIPTTNRPRK